VPDPFGPGSLLDRTHPRKALADRTWRRVGEVPLLTRSVKSRDAKRPVFLARRQAWESEAVLTPGTNSKQVVRQRQRVLVRLCRLGGQDVLHHPPSTPDLGGSPVVSSSSATAAGQTGELGPGPEDNDQVDLVSSVEAELAARGLPGVRRQVPGARRSADEGMRRSLLGQRAGLSRDGRPNEGPSALLRVIARVPIHGWAPGRPRPLRPDRRRPGGRSAADRRSRDPAYLPPGEARAP
jgi:hypothetical protein